MYKKTDTQDLQQSRQCPMKRGPLRTTQAASISTTRCLLELSPGSTGFARGRSLSPGSPHASSHASRRAVFKSVIIRQRSFREWLKHGTWGEKCARERNLSRSSVRKYWRHCPTFYISPVNSQQHNSKSRKNGINNFSTIIRSVVFSRWDGRSHLTTLLRII